jgi:hypothetical protein
VHHGITREHLKKNNVLQSIKGIKHEMKVGLVAFFCVFIMLMSAYSVAVRNDAPNTPLKLFVSEDYNPLFDTDSDGIMDNDEINGYYLYEKVEFEDCIQEWNVDHHQFMMDLSRTEFVDSWLVSAIIDQVTEFTVPGDYHLEATGTGSISLSSGGAYTEEQLAQIEQDEEVLLKAIDLHFYSNGQKLIPVNVIRQWQHQVVETKPMEQGAIIQRTWFIRADYINVQPDSVRLGLNDKAWTGPFAVQYPQIYTDSISISSSSALIDKQCLDFTDPDMGSLMGKSSL